MDLRHNPKISLILFFDGANYYKSNNDPIHAFFSSISELPPILRNSNSNIITHSLWCGSVPDFNVFLSIFNTSLEKIMINGISIDDLKIRVTVECRVCIADAPERALLLNMNRFNGKFSCIMCMQEGENLNKDKRGNNHKFPYNTEQMKVRTQSKYLQQVNESVKYKKCVDGIKGASYLSNWIHLPSNIIIDYMHACLLGTTKQMLNLWLSSRNNKEPFYLGRKIKRIDEILMKVKFPIEFPRKQRSISENISYFKASEYRNFLFYTGIAVLRDFLPKNYYNHFVEYVIFMRLLCNINCQHEHILTSFNIINTFMQKFEKFYGKTNMTFNLHSNLHLPEQVKKY